MSDNTNQDEPMIIKTDQPHSVSMSEGSNVAVGKKAEASAPAIRKVMAEGEKFELEENNFIDGGQELDVGLVEELLGLPQLLVDHAQRRAAVARHEAGGLQAGAFVHLLLRQQQPHQGLGAGEEHGAAVGCEVVAELVRAQGVGHGGSWMGGRFFRPLAGRTCLIAADRQGW